MPPGLAEFFIKFLTKPNMLVVDPFGGSNTTGAAAKSLAAAGPYSSPMISMPWVQSAGLRRLSSMSVHSNETSDGGWKRLT